MSSPYSSMKERLLANIGSWHLLPTAANENPVSAATDESNHLARLLDAERGSANALRLENDTLKSQVRTLTASNASLQRAVDGWNRDEAINALMSERDTALSALKAKDRNLQLLEGLCGVRGIDPSRAVPIADELPSPKATVESYENRLASASSSEERSAILEAFGNAAKEGTVLRSAGNH